MSVRKSFARLESLLRQDSEDGLISLDAPKRLGFQLKGVLATAKGRKAPILQSISAEFEAGKVYVVLGSSGAGKSTLGKVILGIWPEVQGEVLLNGHPVQTLDRQVIGPSLGYLPQDIELFAGTVAENIARMGKPDPEKVIEAARITGTHDLILRLPKGYDTPIGQGGSALSGGQRQRVALARAIYGIPRLIVLDEPNANLDEAGEAALAQALQHVKQRGSTVFLITHRPGIGRLADRIVVMEQGRIDLYGEADAVRQTLAERVRANSASKQLPVQPTTAPQLNGPAAADGSA